MLTTHFGNFKTLDDFDFSDKRVLVRVDLNSPIVEGKVQMNDRIREHALTLKELSQKGAKVVVLAHQGRPGKRDYMESLEEHAKLLSQIVGVKYVNDLIGSEAVERIKAMAKGDVILLKNVRAEEDEFAPSESNIIVKTLAPLFDLFVSDAFSVAHRNQTSVVSFAKVLPSCIGRVMEKELSALNNLKKEKMLCVLGGAKPEDYISLLPHAEKILSGGIFALACLKAKGYVLGKEDELLKQREEVISEIKKFIEKIETPIDLAINENGRKEIAVEQLPVDSEILDVGEGTIRKYTEEIEKAEAVFVKGPLGKFEEKEFAKGSVEILKAVARSKCFSLIGGGHITHVIETFSLGKDNFSHVSLAGGALIKFLAGEKLPGLEVLKCTTS